MSHAPAIRYLLLGPRGLSAVESKHRNGTVSAAGDRWSYVKYDNYGNPAEHGEMTDARGRPPSEQVSQPAAELEEFLASCGHPTQIQRIVLVTHPRSATGTCTRPTVHIATSTRQVISLINRSPAPIAAGDRAELERLIIRDHRHHETRRRTHCARQTDQERCRNHGGVHSPRMTEPGRRQVPLVPDRVPSGRGHHLR